MGRNVDKKETGTKKENGKEHGQKENRNYKGKWELLIGRKYIVSCTIKQVKLLTRQK